MDRAALAVSMTPTLRAEIEGTGPADQAAARLAFWAAATGGQAVADDALTVIHTGCDGVIVPFTIMVLAAVVSSFRALAPPPVLFSPVVLLFLSVIGRAVSRQFRSSSCVQAQHGRGTDGDSVGDAVRAFHRPMMSQPRRRCVGDTDKITARCRC